MRYSKQTVKLIDRVIEDLINNTIEKGARFAQLYFVHKVLKRLDKKFMMC